MYQTARSQRMFTRHVIKPKADKNTHVQTAVKNGVFRYIVHDRPSKSAMDSFNFHLKHNIKAGHVIANGWKMPEGKNLREEYRLILQKKSNLSRKQRNQIVFKITGKS